MPRIAYISSTFPDYQKCGTGIYAGYLCQALVQQGHEVHVLTSALPEIKPTLGKINVHKVMESWNPLDFPKVVQFFHQVRPDIIHINHPTAIAAQKHKILVNMLPEANRVMWRLPLVTTLHEFIHVSRLGKIKLQPFLSSSDIITVSNERSREAVCKHLSEGEHRRARVVTIGSQFDQSLVTKSATNREVLRKQWGLSSTDKVVGFVGFITPPKGFHNLIQAIAPILRNDKNIKILALSSWNLSTPVYRQRILDSIERENITGQVIFTGYLEDKDLWDSLSLVDLCVFPFDEPVEDRSSGPLRQVLLKGLPTLVFADDIQYSEFGFRHGHNIWFTRLGDLNALRVDTSHLLANEDLRKRISAGTQELRAQFSFDSVSNSMSRIYSELLTTRR